MPRRVNDFRGLTQQSRVRLLHAVQREPGRQLKALAEETGLHLNTARDHLAVLENEGLIVSAPADTGRRGRPPKEYSPTLQTTGSGPGARRLAEATDLGDRLRRLNVLDHRDDLGDAAVHQLDALYAHLDDAGLNPEIDEDELTVGLQPCLYENLLDADQPAVCAVHARLVRHQLEQAGGPVQLRQLHPFTGPRRCLLVLGLNGEDQRVVRTGGIGSDRDEVELERHAVEALRAARSDTDTTVDDDDPPHC